MKRLCHQVAVVTGASSGIGRAVALTLAREGSSVVAIGRNSERIEETLSLIAHTGSKGSSMGLSLDVRKESDMKEMAQCVLARYGRIDILVASAGSGGSLTKARQIPFAVVQLPLEEWDEVIDINLKGVFLSNQAVLPVMMKQASGHIINVSSSRGAKKAVPYASAYGASKRGLMGLTAALAEEMCPYNIRVQAVLPDATATPLIHNAPNLAPRGMLTPKEVAKFILHLITLTSDTVLVDPLIAPFDGSNN